MTNLGYLFAAYSIVWLGLFMYLRTLDRRNRELEEELRELRRLIERGS